MPRPARPSSDQLDRLYQLYRLLNKPPNKYCITTYSTKGCFRGAHARQFFLIFLGPNYHSNRYGYNSSAAACSYQHCLRKSTFQNKSTYPSPGGMTLIYPTPMQTQNSGAPSWASTRQPANRHWPKPGNRRHLKRIVLPLW